MFSNRRRKHPGHLFHGLQATAADGPTMPPAEVVWSKNSCGLAVVILQEAAQSLLAAHAALTAADNFLIPRKQ